jgi:hypothetical protein
MSIADIRSAIATAVNIIIPCEPYFPAVVKIPSAFVLPKSGDWNVTLPRQIDNTKYELTVILGQQGVTEEMQARLDSYLESTNTTTSLKLAIENGSYGTSASFVQVTGWRDYGPVTINETNYLGVKFVIETK